MKKLIIKGMDERYFSKKIVEWYLNNKRSLPWRDTTDPYMIWLSEVILQQTRVSQGLPYYEKFILNYPTVFALAAASEQSVLRLWEGLGYYTRARNLHKCAKTIVADYKGKFPGTYEELLSLPGIGEYTAAAIASFAFDKQVAVLDGNVFRVLSRVFGMEQPINSPQGKVAFTDKASRLLPESDVATYNQGIMEFGALHCLPRQPLCGDCPLQSQCFAYNKGIVSILPLKTAKKKSRARYFYYLVVKKDDKILMRRRTAQDIWHGLYDFPLVEKEKPVNPEKIFRNQKLIKRAKPITISEKYVHVLTHQTIHCRFISFDYSPENVVSEDLCFYSTTEIENLPKPVLIARYLQSQSGSNR